MKVKLEIEWEFNKKDWDEAVQHRKEMEKQIQQVVGFDAINAIYHLNGMVYPKVLSAKVEA